jgi:integrase
MKDTTIAVYLAHLRPALSWAVSMGMLPKVPEMHMPVRVKGRKLMRGRPLTNDEFEAMISAVIKVRKHDTAVWKHYLRGLWLSGLRLEESSVLSWDEDAAFAVDLSGRHPRFRIYAEAEKGHQDRLLPMTPDFAELLLQTPGETRAGKVFKLVGKFTHQPISPRRVGRVVSQIGEKAKVVVNCGDGKFASAHDLRRSFGSRWARRVMPATLQLLMRHESIETTMKCYVDLEADELGDELWKSFGPDTLN